MIDLLASNYHDLAYIMEMDFETGLRLIIKARDKREEEKRWQLYCSVYPHFPADGFIPFDEFLKKTTAKVSMKPKEQILEETRKLKKLFAK